MDISVIIPTYNRRIGLFRLLYSIQSSVASSKFKVDYEVLVVDDGGEVECGDVLLMQSTRLHRIPNSGPAAARNVGIRCAAGKLLVFLDDDCVVDSDFFTGVLRVLLELDTFDLACGSIYYFAERVTWISKYLTETQFLRQGGDDDTGFGLEDKIFPTACLFVRKAFLDSTGLLFDERLRQPGGEDDLFSREARRIGGRFRKFSDIAVKHDNSCSWIQFIRRYYSYGYGHVLVCRYGDVPLEKYSIWKGSEILFWILYPGFILRWTAKYLWRYRSCNLIFLSLWWTQKTCVRIGNFASLRKVVVFYEVK